MHNTRHTDSEQAALWNGVAGNAWVELQGLLDDVYRSVETLLLAATPANATRLLDVGCGTGGTTLALARMLGTNAQCTGIDISEPMIAAARERATPEGASVRFVCADVQTHAFETARFDAIVSRFGVMFFDDPVMAFANLRRAARDGAALRLLAWRSAVENPFMTTAEHAAAPLLPNVPARDADAPGQFAFADPHRVAGILAKSGWADIEILPVDISCTFAERDLVRYFTLLGPVGRALRGADERTRARVVDAVRAAFDSYVHGDDVRFDAACWMITARAPAASSTPQQTDDG